LAVGWLGEMRSTAEKKTTNYLRTDMDVTENPILVFQENLKETDKAYQIKFSQTDIHWIPKSQSRIIGNHIYLPKWLIKAKHLEEYELVKDN